MATLATSTHYTTTDLRWSPAIQPSAQSDIEKKDFLTTLSWVVEQQKSNPELMANLDEGNSIMDMMLKSTLQKYQSKEGKKGGRRLQWRLLRIVTVNLPRLISFVGNTIPKGWGSDSYKFSDKSKFEDRHMGSGSLIPCVDRVDTALDLKICPWWCQAQSLIQFSQASRFKIMMSVYKWRS